MSQNSGAVYLFERDVDTFTQKTKISALDSYTNDYFGVSIALYRNMLAVGAHWADHVTQDVGTVDVFSQDASGTFEESFKVTVSDAASKDTFGISVAINDRVLAVSANGNDEAGTAVYIFDI